MHIYQLLIIDKKLKDAFVKFSELPVEAVFFDTKLFEQLLCDSGQLVKTYISLLKSLQILSKDYNDYYKQEHLIKHTPGASTIQKGGTIPQDYLIALQNNILPFFEDNFTKWKQIFPIHIHFATGTELYLFSGINLYNRDEPAVYSLLHEMSIPIDFITYTGHSRLHYLLSIFNKGEYKKQQSIHSLYPGYKVNYRQFRSDCKICFGTTFYNFFIKTKMLSVLDDIMLTDLSLKETAYKHNFSSYTIMSNLFNKHKFSLKTIPRIFKENY